MSLHVWKAGWTSIIADINTIFRSWGSLYALAISKTMKGREGFKAAGSVGRLLVAIATNWLGRCPELLHCFCAVPIIFWMQKVASERGYTWLALRSQLDWEASSRVGCWHEEDPRCMNEPAPDAEWIKMRGLKLFRRRDNA